MRSFKSNENIHKKEGGSYYVVSHIKILGVTFTPEVFNMWDYNAPEIFQKITKLLEIWSKRKLTLQGRLTIIKSLAISKFVHLFLALPNPPGDLIQNLNKLFYKFLGIQDQTRLKEKILSKACQMVD